ELLEFGNQMAKRELKHLSSDDFKIWSTELLGHLANSGNNRAIDILTRRAKKKGEAVAALYLAAKKYGQEHARQRLRFLELSNYSESSYSKLINNYRQLSEMGNEEASYLFESHLKDLINNLRDWAREGNQTVRDALKNESWSIGAD